MFFDILIKIASICIRKESCVHMYETQLSLHTLCGWSIQKVSSVCDKCLGGEAGTRSLHI